MKNFLSTSGHATKRKNKLENILSPPVQVFWQKFPYNFHMIPGAERKNVYTDGSWEGRY